MSFSVMAMPARPGRRRYSLQASGLLDAAEIRPFFRPIFAGSRYTRVVAPPRKGRTSDARFPIRPPRNWGPRDIRDRRQGHLPESWARRRPENREPDHHGYDLRVLPAPHGVERDHGARSG